MEEKMTREQMLAQKYPKKEKNKYLGFLMLYRFVALGLINGAFSLFLAMMVEDLGFDMAQRALLVTMNSVGQLVAAFVVGFLIDRVNSKMVLCVAMIAASVTCILRFNVTSFPIWAVLMLIWGLCYNAVLVGTVKILGLWFTRSETHQVNGYFTLAGPLGQLIGLQVALTVAEKMGGWRQYYLMLGIIALISGLLILFLCKNRPNEDSEVAPNYEKKDTGLIKDIVALAKIPRMWMLFIGEAAQASMISIVATYAVLVLQNDPGWGLDVAVARRITQMVMLGAVLGYFIVPNLAKVFRKKFKQPEMAVAVFTIICGLGMATLYIASYKSYSFMFALIGCLIGGIFQGGYIVGPKTVMVMLPECAGPRAGSATSMASIIGRIALVVVSAASGAIAAATHDSANVMVFMYAPIYIGSIAMIAFVIMHKKHLAKQDQK